MITLPAEAPQQPQPAPPAPGWVEPVLRVAGASVALAAAVVTAVAELVLATLRVGGVLIGVAVPVAIAANWAVAWFAWTTTGRRWGPAVPAAAWILLMVVAAGTRTAEGDFLITGDNWVALVMILLGCLTYGAFAYRLILRTTPTRA